MSLLSKIGFGTDKTTTANQPKIENIFPFSCSASVFTEIDIITLYKRILTDVLERTYGIPEELHQIFWDSCLASDSKDGLITLLAEAMFNKQDLYLVYLKPLKMIRKADGGEKAQIQADYKSENKSNVGFYITFSKFSLTDMLKIYSFLEYCTVYALHKGSNLSTAIQIKAKELRASVGNNDAETVIEQAVAIADALRSGQDVLMDGDDKIETTTPDMDPIDKSMAFIDRKKSYYLGLPASYITGLAGASMSDTGEREAKAVERGLKAYYFSIIKPVVEKIFDIKVTFKSEDYYGISTALSALTTFEATSEDIINLENKTSIANKLFGLPQDAKGDGRQETE